MLLLSDEFPLVDEKVFHLHLLTLLTLLPVLDQFTFATLDFPLKQSLFDLVLIPVLNVVNVPFDIVILVKCTLDLIDDIYT